MKHPIRKRWGQNFLQDSNIAQKIVAVLNPQSDDFVLEIGPGFGALTSLLAQKVAQIKAVEIDPLLVEKLRTSSSESVEVIKDDFLKYDISAFPPGYKIIGNLPYNITSPIIFKLFENPNWDRAVFMIQKEVAERICSEPGNKIYGRLSVMVQIFSDVEYHFTVPSTVFYPKPEVESAVISIIRKSTKNLNYKIFSDVVRNAFNQRRKKIRNALNQFQIDTLLPEYSEQRAEQLTPQDFLQISKVVEQNQF